MSASASASEWFSAACNAVVALSLAAVIVLAVRRPLRRLFGAHVAYCVWALLPAALLGSLLPPPTIEVIVASPAPVNTGLVPAATTLAQMPQNYSWLWLLLWAFGIAATALYFLRLQRRFVRSLGDLSAVENGIWRADSRHGLPALIGLFPPRIVVPADFETRYDEAERSLMLTHERAHLRRGDPLANLVFVALRTVFWFNPLLHFAARKFRDDQEFACDQRVIAASPQSRRAYADAMLKTLVAAQPVPLGCHWGLAHPLKERLVQLKTQPPHRAMRILGASLALALAAGTAFAVWSAQTPRVVSAIQPTASVAAASQPRSSDIRIDIATSIDGGEASRFAMHSAYGVPFSFVHEDGGKTLDVSATVERTSAGQYDIRAKIKQNGKQVAAPRLITESGKSAVVRIGSETSGADAKATNFHGIEIDFTVSPIRASATSHKMLSPTAPLPPMAPPPPPPPPAAALAPVPPPPPPPPAAALAPVPPLPPTKMIAPLPPVPPSPPLAPDAPSSPSLPPLPPEVSRAPTAHSATSARTHAAAVSDEDRNVQLAMIRERIAVQRAMLQARQETEALAPGSAKSHGVSQPVSTDENTSIPASSR
jgi:bla regulator protein blaR1